MSNLQTYYFKLDFQKVAQHTGGKWLIHGTKRRKDNQLQSLEDVKAAVFQYRFNVHSGNGHGYQIYTISNGTPYGCHRSR